VTLYVVSIEGVDHYCVSKYYSDGIDEPIVRSNPVIGTGKPLPFHNLASDLVEISPADLSQPWMNESDTIIARQPDLSMHGYSESLHNST
jgi:hypothetical protein